MTNDQIKLPDDEPGQSDASKLLKLDAGNATHGAVVSPMAQARDINAKITTLEDSLGELQSELDAINRSVESGLERLSDKDLDLTAKVSETYKRLGEIDRTYKSLSAISENIDVEVRKLAGEIGDVADQSSRELENFRNRTAARDQELNAQHRELVERVNALTANTKETHERLTRSIQQNTDALLKLEKDLIAEINLLANSSRKRDDELDDDIKGAHREIAAGKARMLQMQSVDEALAKRATELEVTAAGLGEKVRLLDSSVELLNVRTHDLSISIDRLYALNRAHATLIGDLQKQASGFAASLLALAGTEKYHFRALTGGLLLVLLSVAVLYFYIDHQAGQAELETAQRTAIVDQQLSVLGDDVTGLNRDLAQTSGAVTDTQQVLQSQIEDLNRKVVKEVDALNNRVQGMDDQVQSLDGRLDYSAPFSAFGKDSVIHGPHWLQQQPAANYVVELVSAGDRQTLYETAQRYSRYLVEELAWYAVDAQGAERFVLTYGSFGSVDEARSAVYRLPRNVNFQRPRIRQAGEVQGLIGG